MSTITGADPMYRRDLGNGLIERWSTIDDVENVAQLCGNVFRDKEDEPLNVRIIDNVHQQMHGSFPFMGAGDYALIEDTRKEGNPLVACTCLFSSEWEYEGIPFGLGQPEFVATHPDYRHRGLIRNLFKMIHARSESKGHLVQAIAGIFYFYRQFGYEYALELEGRRVTYLSLIPKARENTPELYSLRAATPDDIPLIENLYKQQRSASAVWAVVTRSYWHYQLEERDVDPVAVGKQACIYMLVDAAGVVQGYTTLSNKRRGKTLHVWTLDLFPGTNWQKVSLPLLRALQKYGEQLPTVTSEAGPLSEISFDMGSTHPIYEVLGETLAPFYEPPYAWYVRVPNLLAFLQHIIPALEQRLANSVAASSTGELKLDLYRQGLHMTLDRGHITSIDPWVPPTDETPDVAHCPPLVFLQLLFGHRNLDELRYAFPDVQVRGEPEVLLKALFPKKFSRIMPLM